MRWALLFFAAFPLYSQITADTVAGGAIRSGVPAQNVFLDNITGLTWDPSGNLVFCDQVNNVIRRVRADGTLETIAGTGVWGFAGDGGPASAALLNTPASPRYDAAGNLYFADTLNYRVRRVDPGGTITTVAGDGVPFVTGMDTTGPALQRSIAAGDMAVAANGNVYLWASQQILSLTPDGQLRNFVSLAAYQNLGPWLAMDGSGNFYVLQNNSVHSEAILRIAPDGTASNFRLYQTTGNTFVPAIRSIVADAAGNVYGIESNSIVRSGQDGSDATIAGGGQQGLPSSPDGPALPSVIAPSSLAVDSRGNVAFADNFVLPIVYLTLNELRVVTANSQLQTLAGAAPQIVPDGTPLASAWFEQPASIAFDRSGNLYLAEFRACMIRKISPAGVLSTFAGTGNCAYPGPSGPNAKTADMVQPYSIAVDSQNRVWVADDYLNLYSIAQDGTIGPIIKTPVEGGKGLLAIDSKDRVYVLGMDSLYRVLADGSYQSLIPPPSNGGSGTYTDLTGIGADAAGNVYFMNFGTIYAIHDDGTFGALYNNPLNFANSLAIDASGRVWQGAGGGEIDISSAAGLARMGNFRTGFSGDGGPAMSAGFNGAGSLAFSPSGDLYLLNGNRIRKLSGIATAVPAPTISAVVNSASYATGGLAPGELVSIFGSGFGTQTLQAAAPVNNSYPLALGRTRVLFNGIPGALTAVTPNQIDVFVPIAGSGPVTVEVDAALSQPFNVTSASTAPALFAADASGAGQGAILNQDESINSAANPAARGSIVAFYGTGLGATTPRLFDGYLAISTPFPQPQSDVTVTIGGQPAQVVYAGAAPFLPNGVFQINAVVPAGIAPGNAPVMVTAGGIASTGAVTVAIQ